LARGVLYRALPPNRTSDTSVAAGARAFAYAWRLPSGLPRPVPPPLREDEAGSPTRGAFHRRVAFTRTREPWLISCAVTCSFRGDPTLGTPSSAASPAGLAPHLRLLRTRSPSPSIAPPRAHRAERRPTLLWTWMPLNDFCNCIPTHGHALKRPVLALRPPGGFTGTPELAPVLAAPMRA